jgi:hypothetical protein
VRFWDSSAVVPLLVTQVSSSQTDQWLDEDVDIAIWTLTPVEVASALRRLVREGQVSEPHADEAERRMGELVLASHLIVDVDAVKSRAGRVLRVHPLRAADAMQLGAALEWASGNPTGRILYTLDTRLALAAGREGFTVPHAAP